MRVLTADETFGSERRVVANAHGCSPQGLHGELPSISADRSADVAILLGTMNGRQFLAEQLDSIAAQTDPDWCVWASDDGSQDGTLALLERYRKMLGNQRISMLTGPRKGSAANFLFLACHPDIHARYYAYADQDDIWEADKLARAVAWLQGVPADIPALYCSRTRLIDEQGRETGFSPLFARTPSFANALVQNVGGGNTMVFNNATRRLLCEAGDQVYGVTHDWWTYMVVSGCGGKVKYDPLPGVRYRQHENNLVGANFGWQARAQRAKMLLDGLFHEWNDANIQSLQHIRSRLTPESRHLLDEFCSARQRTLLPRLIGIRRSGIYRQTQLGNLGLVMAALLNKL